MAVVLAVMVFVLSMASLMPATMRAVRQRRAIRYRDAQRALEYSGEVVRTSPSATTYYGLAGRHINLVVRRDEGATITVLVPVGYGGSFPVGCRVVRSAGLLWPRRVDVPPRDPTDDHRL